MFYVSSTMMWSYPVEQAVLLAKEYQFIGVEVWAEHVWYHNSDPATIRQRAKEEEMALSLHAASWDLNLCSLNRGIRQASIEQISKSLELAEQLGAFHVTIHPGRMSITDALQSWHREVLQESLSHLAQAAHTRGLSLSVEHIEPLPKELVVTPAEMNQLLAAIPYSLTTTFDVAHVPLHLSPLTFYRQLDKIAKVHISDANRHKLHLPLGEGEIDLHEVLPVLVCEQPVIVVEGLDFSQHLPLLKKNAAYLQEWALARSITG